uniref:C-type lectin domain-containing protein n=1 Tax=Mola mola TaxID=94237 RepID=A0A3Q3VKA1_MOLML
EEPGTSCTSQTPQKLLKGLHVVTNELKSQMVCLGGARQPCYKMAYFHDVSSRVAFKEAGRACRMDGGSLLSIESSAEQADVENLLGIADGDFWIGLTRVDEDGQSAGELSNSFASCPQLYRWTDGSPASFRNWYFDEPSCGGEACVVMYHQPSALPGLGGAYLYQWNDDRCNMKHNFICKYGPGTISQSAACSTEPTSYCHLSSLFPFLSFREQSCQLLVYVIIPTIPLLLLILVASGTCCFQMLSRR